VESLLAANDSAADDFLNVTPHVALGLEAFHGTMIGRRLGPYELTAEIGVGGMGEVYRARRVDDEYQHEVAIKLVHAGPGSSFVGSRLRAERQILASLQHPNIARLLDGGTTETGIPYLVMELIDGQLITDYCDEHRLDTTARLKLFLQVCSAVQYAHQRMVIHRDLKPGNILVTREGVPKLLDFGISKILEPGASTGGSTRPAEHTIATLGILTPQYASPEQLLGEPVTTASDVYSLGVLLYELLTGVRPYSLPDGITNEQRLAAQGTEPRRPSAVARERRLRGDLDRIVLMALRREPERRYGTAEQLADDVQRHLEHRPVTARPATASYVVSSFLRRHAFGATLSTVIVVGLAVGVVAVWREKEIAEGHRAQAEMRFNDVRRLANSLIFDIDNSIRDLPGAGPSRRRLIDTALEYFGSLAKDAAGDPALQAETATAYQRLGDVQGSFELGQDDYSGALKSYQQALTLLQSAAAADPRNEQVARDIGVIYYSLSDLLWVMGDVKASLSYSEHAYADSRVRLERASTDTQNRFWTALYGIDYGYKLFRLRGDAAGSLQYMRETLASLEPIARARSTARVSRLLGVSYYKTSEVLLYLRRYPEALDMNQKAIRLFEASVAAAPADPDLRVNLAAARHYAAAALMGLDRFQEARQNEQAALVNVRVLLESDPGVSAFQGFYGMGLTGMAGIAEREGQPEKAIEHLKEGLQALDAALTAGTKHPYIRHSKARAEELMGVAFEAKEQWASAREWYGLALKSFQDVTPVWAEAADDAKRVESALARCQKAGVSRS
jgi:non-specific serine/threonine protein kinase/serine/threonine-protein kinase